MDLLPTRYAAFLGACLLALISCKSKSGKAGILLHFDIENREVKYVNKDLEEISGIVFTDSAQGLAAINDEEGRIYFIDYTGTTPTRHHKFGKHGDYEDIAADADHFYVLESKGVIHPVSRQTGEADGQPVEWGSHNDEFEALYLDAGEQRLVMLCKNCREYEKKGQIPAFAFNLGSRSFSKHPLYTIEVKAVRRLLQDKYLDCKPSAAAIHPILRKLFVLCSVGKVLLVCDVNGKLEEAFRLDPDFFPQPEGLCFSPNGDLYISNEGKGGQGTIIRFPYVMP